MKNITSNLSFWVFGTVTALAGVAVARLLAPEMGSEHLRLTVAIGGRLLALIGLCAILFGIHRRIQVSVTDTHSETENHVA